MKFILGTIGIIAILLTALIGCAPVVKKKVATLTHR